MIEIIKLSKLNYSIIFSTMHTNFFSSQSPKAPRKKSTSIFFMALSKFQCNRLWWMVFECITWLMQNDLRFLRETEKMKGEWEECYHVQFNLHDIRIILVESIAKKRMERNTVGIFKIPQIKQHVFLQSILLSIRR